MQGQATMDLLLLVLVTSLLLPYSSMKQGTATPIEKPAAQEIRHIGLPTKGKYSVHEESKKASTNDHENILSQGDEARDICEPAGVQRAQPDPPAEVPWALCPCR